MIHLIALFAVAAFAIVGLTLWSCLLLASWADTRLDEFVIGTDRETFRPRFFESESD
jgi:hypothetical protein